MISVSLLPATRKKGLFSSTRKGRGNDEIYSFELPPLRFSVTGLVKDEKSGEPVNQATVQLIAVTIPSEPNRVTGASSGLC
ncbi:MAG: hypothetical protein R2727_09955 [Bacteroidales bacterium]